MNGWWKFHRGMLDHAVWGLSDSQRIVWITILSLANHRDQDWWNGTERVTIPAGSLITSQDHLAKLSRTSRKTVRLAITNLCQTGSIRANIRANKYTEITLVNADKYRGSDVDGGQDEGPLGANQGPTRGQLGATTGEGEKGKKGRRVRKSPAEDNGHWPSPRSLVNLYNTLTPDNVPSVETLSEKRLEKARRYLRMFPEQSWWEEVFRQYHRSRFLSGKKPPREGHESFQPDFDWLLSVGKDRTENAVKVHDGRYSDGP